MQNDPYNNEAPVRHRRSERHASARKPSIVPGPDPENPSPASSLRGTRKLPALPVRGRSFAKAGAKPRRGEKLPPYQVAALLILVVACIFGAYSLWNNSLKITELRDERAKIETERRNTVLRHQPVYTDLIEHWAERNGIEPAFVCAVIYRESHYDPRAVSSAGARGLMQLMPDTGTWWAGNLGIRDYTAESLFTPDMNIRLGVRYLRYLSEKFDGDPILVACGYHAGSGNVESWISRFSADGRTLTLDEIPMEDTRTYARRVMDSYAIYLQYYYPSEGRL
ncbi:MAG: lytic transglycosylase domain-containing protein [Clostridia bacterium]|nr:lytic transglycosylase domain-containing protein [Clostridia bacterium]